MGAINGGISAEAHDLARRAAKKRQRDNAHARSANRTKSAQSVSLTDIVKEQRKANARRQSAIQLGEENGQRLLAEARTKNVFVLNSDDASGIDVWKRNVRDVINAAKNDAEYWHWNRTWLEDGRLMLALKVKEQKKAA